MAAILIIEDDHDIQELLSFAFASQGWKLLMAKTGEEGLALLRSPGGVDCVVLDIMLPGMDGFKTLKKVKADDALASVPVIIASARGEETDVVAGLELGADDYVVKPYSPRILAARIRAALRRAEESGSTTKTQFRQGTVRLDADRYEAFNGEQRLELSATEFSLLRHFLSNPDRVFSRNQIINAVHGSDYPVTDRSVDVQVLALRKKLGDAGSMIETIRGVGYRLKTT
ncbi:MAG: response regulator transcription factor [Treponema sp.]|nr:response regulator transcription factor [Treponema sp.]